MSSKVLVAVQREGNKVSRHSTGHRVLDGVLFFHLNELALVSPLTMELPLARRVRTSRREHMSSDRASVRVASSSPLGRETWVAVT